MSPFWMLIFVITFNEIESNGLNKRCIKCRSRGEFGSCRDPFPFNVSQSDAVAGIDIVPCSSGWCGKFIEGNIGPDKTDDYSVATQRLCLLRAPTDYEERCADTLWNHRRVFMCFCNGDLCNSAHRPSSTGFYIVILIFLLVITDYLPGNFSY